MMDTDCVTVMSHVSGHENAENQNEHVGMRFHEKIWKIGIGNR